MVYSEINGIHKKELKQLSKHQLIEIILELGGRVARLEKNSKTSSKPPSSDINFPKRNQSLRSKSGRNPGGQSGHVGKTREQVENPDDSSSENKPGDTQQEPQGFKEAERPISFICCHGITSDK